MTTFNEILRLMKRLEWGDRGACPICHAAVDSPKGHDLDCELMALIQKMDSTPMVCRPMGTVERTLEKLNVVTAFK